MPLNFPRSINFMLTGFSVINWYQVFHNIDVILSPVNMEVKKQKQLSVDQKQAILRVNLQKYSSYKTAELLGLNWSIISQFLTKTKDKGSA